MMTIEQIYELLATCKGLVTDSRKVEKGTMFLALKGEKFDGNDFALKALQDGASFAVVDRPSLGDHPGCILVDDTLKAFQRLARHHRDQFDIPVIGLTGTNGKTTTKELINAVLSRKYVTLATSGNFNNSIGVPLTVLSLRPEHQIAVVEMGASHPGDIDELVAVSAPTFGLITNVGKAHLLGFGSFEGVKRTKGELYDFLLANGGTAFVNRDNPHLCGMASGREGMPVIGYGLNFSGARVLPVTATEPFLRISLPTGETVRTRLVGSYNADNVMAALAVGERFGVAREDAIAAVEQYEPTNNRSQLLRRGNTTYIVDAYNANPTSMTASVENFSRTLFPHKVAILGDMLELGADSVEEHRAIVKLAQGCGFDEVYYVGSEFAAAGAPNVFPDVDALRTVLSDGRLGAHTVLVKGSHGIGLQKLISSGE